ncbi:hypothetical protein H4219_001888 [Mycoemilia scoparia]|uniref:Uncharacterized protein n=1 Tax=Mycoemilia scoparia TaxID=417184 RepID=A0A9W7ZYY9_9FUNG|nr:hypothetical protein H4219_001888 [Mycoemilia scoparia]
MSSKIFFPRPILKTSVLSISQYSTAPANIDHNDPFGLSEKLLGIKMSIEKDEKLEKDKDLKAGDVQDEHEVDTDDSEDDIDEPTAFNTVYNLLNELIDINSHNRRKAESLATMFGQLHESLSKQQQQKQQENISPSSLPQHKSPKSAESIGRNSTDGIDSKDIALVDDRGTADSLHSPTPLMTPTPSQAPEEEVRTPTNKTPKEPNEEEQSSTPLPMSLYSTLSPINNSTTDGSTSKPLGDDNGTPQPRPPPALSYDANRISTPQPRTPSISTASGTLMSEGTQTEMGGKESYPYRLRLRSGSPTPTMTNQSNSASNTPELQEELEVIKKENRQLRDDLSRLLDAHKEQQATVQSYEAILSKALQALRSNNPDINKNNVYDETQSSSSSSYINNSLAAATALSKKEEAAATADYLQNENKRLKDELANAASTIRCSINNQQTSTTVRSSSSGGSSGSSH